MQRVNHSILPKQHPYKKSVEVTSKHNSFYEFYPRARVDNSCPRKSASYILPHAGKEYGFAYSSAWKLDD